MENETNWARLTEPFESDAVKWRVSRAGIHQVGAKRGEPWCLVVPYIGSTACQERLDDVFGSNAWQTETRHVEWSDGGKMQTGFICRLSVYDETRTDWVWKEDGAPATHIEAFKGGISDAFKRVCASGFGIGRYLRYMPKVIFAQAQWKNNDSYERATLKDKEQDQFKQYYWYIDSASVLPEWALPGGRGKPNSL